MTSDVQIADSSQQLWLTLMLGTGPSRRRVANAPPSNTAVSSWKLCWRIETTQGMENRGPTRPISPVTEPCPTRPVEIQPASRRDPIEPRAYRINGPTVGAFCSPSLACTTILHLQNAPPGPAVRLHPAFAGCAGITGSLDCGPPRHPPTEASRHASLAPCSLPRLLGSCALKLSGA